MATDYRFRIKGEDDTQSAFKSVQSSLGGMQKRVTSLATSIGALVGVGGMGLLIKRTIDAGDEIQKLSIRLGASTEALSQYRHVANLSGVSFETLTMGLQRMTRRVAEAAQGTGEAKNALQELGIDAQQLAAMRPEQQFEILADALAGVTTESDRVRLAMKLFDSEGVSLLQTMQKGSAGIREMREQADDLGLTLSGEQAQNMADFNNSLDIMQARFTGLAQNALPPFFDILGKLADHLNGKVLPAFNLLLEDLGMVEVAVENMNLDEVQNHIFVVKQNIADLKNEQGFGDTVLKMLGVNPASTEDIEAINALEARLVKLQGRLAELRAGGSSPGAGSTGAGGGAAPGSSGAPAASAEETPGWFTGLTDQQLEDELQAAIDAEERLNIEHQRMINERIANEQRAASLITNARMNAYQQGVALLQAFAGKSKTAAIAAIALSKGLQIAQTIMSTETAAMQARTAMLVPGDPSSVARAEAAAAAIRTAGRISVGLIAATGLAQAANVGGGAGGGAAIGTPGNPIQTTDSNPLDSAGTTADPGTQGTINIVVNGVLTQDIVDQVLVPSIRQSIDDRDVILISGSSRNAQELMA